MDADPAALDLARAALSKFGDSVRLIESNFRDLGTVLSRNDFLPVHGILFDLGVSSMQLSDEDRGFSFQAEAPLDMRFGPGQAMTAADVVNEYTEADLANLIWRYGEEPASRRIAREIVRSRPVGTTTQLAGLVSRAVRGGRQRLHPATRTFQALRIVVNDELSSLSVALEQARDALGVGGRLVVIAFHSLEDRIVKQFFQREARDCVCPPELPACVCGHKATLCLLTRGAVKPGPREIQGNRRSRSARLRAAERIGEAG